MHQSMTVKVGEGAQRRLQRCSCFRRREPSLGNNLRQVLFGVLHHHKDQLSGVQPATSCLQETNEVRMRQFFRQSPAVELEFGLRGICRNQFDCSLLSFAPRVCREEYGAFVRTAQVFLQVKLIVDDLAFPTTPGLGHLAPLPLPLCDRSLLAPNHPSRISPSREFPELRVFIWIQRPWKCSSKCTQADVTQSRGANEYQR